MRVRTPCEAADRTDELKTPQKLVSRGDQNRTLEHQKRTAVEHQKRESVPPPLRRTAPSMVVWRVDVQDTALRKRNRSGSFNQG